MTRSCSRTILAFGPDGHLYMTDSGILFESSLQAVASATTGVRSSLTAALYRIDTESGDITQLDSGIGFTNGIAFDAAGDLYVSETLTGMIYRYRLSAGAGSAQREPFGNVVAPYEEDELRGPDGMKFAADGDLYVTVFGQGTSRCSGAMALWPDASRRAAERRTLYSAPGSHRVFVTEDE
ncbi:MAG: SMP-30/gluconolactonase/LRE family protein [Acidimicrobiia bacterium]|nr:SMP-30/gluconolactonase/LRE family protein [Acidimicrobiia bacterium]